MTQCKLASVCAMENGNVEIWYSAVSNKFLMHFLSTDSKCVGLLIIWLLAIIKLQIQA